VVKQKGELAIAGKGFPNESDQCRLYAPPFTFAMQLSFQMLQRNDGDITMTMSAPVQERVAALI
jgi:hypothetical protein